VVLSKGASDKVYQLLALGRWFSPVTPASSTTKTGRHDIAEILLKVTPLSTTNQIKSNHNHVDLQMSVYVIGNKREILQCNKTREIPLKVDYWR
jgi:hypothetical protein